MLHLKYKLYYMDCYSLVTYLDLKFELYYMDFIIIPNNISLFMLYLIIFYKLVILKKFGVNFCLFYDIHYSRVFGLVQIVVPFSLDYVKTVWFDLVSLYEKLVWF